MVSISMLSTAVLPLLLLLPLVMGISRGPLDSSEDAVSVVAQPTGSGGAHRRQRRSATEEWGKWRKCQEEQCSKVTCSECNDGDTECADRCRANCECGCSGRRRDDDMWEVAFCHPESKCREEFEQCTHSCAGGQDGQECVAGCELDHKKCPCACVWRARTDTERKKRRWEACLLRHQFICRECQGADDPGGLCAKKCRRNYECGCAGLLWRYRDHFLSGEWDECFNGTRTCEEARSACAKGCGGQECRNECDMALLDCRCECRTAKEEEWRVWDDCKHGHGQCKSKTCGECTEGDRDCADRCRRNCECSECLGIPADSLDDLSLQECKIKNGCQSEYKKCHEKCQAAQECENSCILASQKCSCECAQTSASATESRESERVDIIQHCNYIH